MDVLSEIIASIHIDGSVLSEICCGGDWGIDMGTGDGIPFHYVIEGKCWLLGGARPVALSTGDLVVAMHWPRHALGSSPQSTLETAEHLVTSHGLQFWRDGTLDRPNVLHAGSGEKTVKILAGVFALKGRGAAILIGQLPSLMHLRNQDENLGPQLKMALQFIHNESQNIRPGYVAVASRLMDLLFIQVLRSAIMQPTVHIGILKGIADSNIGRALAAIHASPSAPWTVATLAQEACLSRTTFAERFRQLVGITPIQYVVRWRMTVAEDLLVRSDISIELIRSRLGYESSFVFARAFRAYSGLSPREYRQSFPSRDRSKNH